MKKLFILSTLFSSFIWSSSLSSAEITEMISKIKKERAGISIKKLENTVNPFILVKIKKEENLTKEIEKEEVLIEEIIIEPTYSLDAILNHSAFINKKWYKKGSKIDQYRVVYIGKRTVTLRNSEKEKKLSLKNKKYMKLH